MTVEHCPKIACPLGHVKREDDWPASLAFAMQIAVRLLMDRRVWFDKQVMLRPGMMLVQAVQG